MSGDDDSVRTRAALFEAVDRQLRSKDPPEALQTLERLLHLGYSHEDALKLIASAFVAEMSRAMKLLQPFDAARYVDLLRQLPGKPAAAPSDSSPPHAA